MLNRYNFSVVIAIFLYVCFSFVGIGWSVTLDTDPTNNIWSGADGLTTNSTYTAHIEGDNGTSGTTANGTTPTLTDSSKTWTTDFWENLYVYVTDNSTSYEDEQPNEITSNTGTILSVSGNWTTPGTGRSYSIHGHDWFSFSATEGNVYTIEVNSTAIDPYVELYGKDGTTLIDYNNDSSGTNSSIVWVCQSTPPGVRTGSGTYYIKVMASDANYSNNATGNYTISITETTPTSDDYGDTYDTATALTIGTGTDGSIETQGDVDFFSFSASANTTYTIETSLSTLDDSIIYLYDTDGSTLLTYNDDRTPGSDLSSLIKWNCQTAGTYYVKVKAFSTSQTGSYTITVSNVGTPSTVDDYGNTYNASYPPPGGLSLASSSSNSTSGTINYNNDVDFFTLTTNSTANTTTIEISLGTLKDSYMELYDNDGTTLLAYDDDGGSGLASKIVSVYKTVTGEVIEAGDGTTTGFAGTFDYSIVNPGTVTVYATVGGNSVSMTDDSHGKLSGTAGNGWIDYSTGAYYLTFSTAPDSGTNVTADYNAGLSKGSTYYIKLRALTQTDTGTYTITATASP